MKRNRILWFVVLIVVIATIATSLKTSYSQQNQKQSEVKSNPTPFINPPEKERDKEATPIVDFNGANANIEQSRINKNARYDKYKFVESESPNTYEVIQHPGENDKELDMPVEESDLIIEGQVTDSKAFLSNDKTGIYSEFTIAVSKVLKNAGGDSIKADENIAAERPGGRVRYPSGEITRYTMSGLGSPSINSKYLFFLTKTKENGYKILTGYELKNGKVLALDGGRTYQRSGVKTVFDNHNGRDYESFVNEIKKMIEKTKEANKNEKVHF
jgi:hypothetical protein